VKFVLRLALFLALAALVAGCGGGGTTTLIERTVTVERSEAGGSTEGGDETTEGREAEGNGGESTGGDDDGGESKDNGGAGDNGGGRSGQAEDRIEAPTAVVHLQTFRSPSGNIGCAMFEGGARCDIRKREWSPPPHPASCSGEVDFGQGLAVSHDGEASFVCAGDTTLDPSATSLEYGEASELGGTICMSRSEGITCANHAGHGFFISIQGYKIF
jgi:hypothetical protein